MSDSKSKKKHEPIYVIAGKESDLVGIRCTELVDRLLTDEEKTTCLLSTDSEGADIAQVLDELRTLPFLADKRVVLIRNADKFVTANRGALENYFDNPCLSGILILTVSSWVGSTKLAKKLRKEGLISVSSPTRGQLPSRLVQYAKDAHGKNLSAEAAGLLIELAGDSLGRLYGEVDKLALFANDDKNITVKHIESLIGNNRLFNAFNVIDSILAGDAVDAVERLRNMFETDRSTEYTVVGAFAFHFRKLFGAKALLEKGVSSFEVTRKMNVWGNTNGFFAQVRKMTLKQIGDNIQRLAEIDYEIKTGRANAKVAIEQMVLKTAAGRI